MNHEGALNLEYLKWSDLTTPEHNLNMLFTRMIAGPMDYHLGGFRSVPRNRFKPINIGPNVLGTRCHHLAMYVCFDNPNPMVADYPAAYEGQTGFEFLRRVPTWWDETRVLEGKIGEVAVTARRKGSLWYVGCMSAGAARSVKLQLGFLTPGTYRIEVWKDSAEAEQDPNRLTTEIRHVRSGEQLTFQVARDGGFVAEISPEVDRTGTR
jgi:alpha-glucosidase